jgi:predicted 3-demethylubiquinone-9 3-methyltransferase (glyoxalase superfamily)
VFKQSKKGFIARYPKGQGPDKEGTVMFMDFQLDGTWFAGMDSAHDHKFNFNEAVSLMIPCKTLEGDRLLLGEALGRAGSRTMRLAQG